MNRAYLLRTTSKFASMGMFDGWAGQSPGRNPEQAKTDETAGAGGSGASDGTKVAAKGNDAVDDSSADSKLVDDIWKQAEAEGTKATDGDGTTVKTATTEVDTDTQVASYLKKIGLEPIVLSEQEIEGFKNGEGFQELVTKLNAKIANAHVQAVTSANKLMDNKIADAVKKAVGESATLLRDTKARDALHAAMPWAKNPRVAPIAETILGQFLKKSNGDIPRSIELTKLYFNAMQTEMDPEARSNGNQGGSNRKSGAATPNWINTLTGKD